jgi:hypothetical protein
MKLGYLNGRFWGADAARSSNEMASLTERPLSLSFSPKTDSLQTAPSPFPVETLW